MKDAYFLKLKGKDAYIHPIGKKFGGDYQVKDGVVGACIFTRYAAEVFIKLYGIDNLDIVHVSKCV